MFITQNFIFSENALEYYYIDDINTYVSNVFDLNVGKIIIGKGPNNYNQGFTGIIKDFRFYY